MAPIAIDPTATYLQALASGVYKEGPIHLRHCTVIDDVDVDLGLLSA